MSVALACRRSALSRSWRQAAVLALIIGILGAVALGSLAGARRTATAYDRYLTSINASNTFVNVPGVLPGLPVTRPIDLISALPGVISQINAATGQKGDNLSFTINRTDVVQNVLSLVRRRRRELALLKTIGMTRRQVRAVVAWQTTLTLLIAVVVLGLAVLVLAGDLLAALPAAVAARTRPATELRAE